MGPVFECEPGKHGMFERHGRQEVIAEMRSDHEN
jgi:hypothetical protein